MPKKPISQKTFRECSLAELKEEAVRQMALLNLKCPECGKKVLRYHIEEDNEVAVFECLFSAMFDRGISPEEAQKKLDEFKSSGKMEEWLKRGIF
jgi:predicted  nucleic acid-binding Zn-ribbon protein